MVTTVAGHMQLSGQPNNRVSDGGGGNGGWWRALTFIPLNAAVGPKRLTQNGCAATAATAAAAAASAAYVKSTARRLRLPLILLGWLDTWAAPLFLLRTATNARALSSRGIATSQLHSVCPARARACVSQSHQHVRAMQWRHRYLNAREKCEPCEISSPSPSSSSSLVTRYTHARTRH